jgi:type I restriction enzyme S subunit
MMQGWKEYSLGDVLKKIVGGGTPSKSKPEYWDGDIYWCTVKDMKDGKFRLFETQDKITEIGLKNSSSNLIKSGTVITSTRMGLGRAFINYSDMAINQDLKALIPNEKIDNQFLLWTLNSLKDEIDGLGSGSTVKGIRLETLRAIKINLPTLPIQRKIASILSAYDDLIENNLKRIKLLEEMAQKTYEEWFVKFRIDGEQLPINKETGLPVCWEQRKLGYLCSKITDGTHDTPKQTEDGIKLITGKHILNGFIDFESAYTISESDHLAIKKRSGLEKGDILFSNIGTLGNIAFVNQDFEFSCKNVFIFKQKKGYTNFLYTYLSSENIKQKLSNQSSGVAQKFYSLKFIRDLTDYLPTDDLIIKFDNYISPIYKLKYKLDNQNQKLKEARDILLPRLMTGMIDVEKMEIKA